jgi:hypothetical protein
MPATSPLEDTLAAAEFDDDQVARLVTSCVVPSMSVAVAVNCDVAPTAGAVPATASDETVVGDVAELPHAIVKAVSSAAIATEPPRRTRVPVSPSPRGHALDISPHLLSRALAFLPPVRLDRTVSACYKRSDWRAMAKPRRVHERTVTARFDCMRLLASID